jgi:hypothetical protein
MTVWEMSEVQKWNVVHIQRILLSSGYIADDIKSARFHEISNDLKTAIFTITFYDQIEGELDSGYVYVKVKDGFQFVADF